jgi:hypothetical protein
MTKLIKGELARVATNQVFAWPVLGLMGQIREASRKTRLCNESLAVY